MRFHFAQDQTFSETASLGQFFRSRKLSFVNFDFQKDDKIENQAEDLDNSVDLDRNLEDVRRIDSGADVESERLPRRSGVPDELGDEAEAFDPAGQETAPEVVVKRGRILEPEYVGEPV